LPQRHQDPPASPKAKPTRLPAPEAQLMAGRWRAGTKAKYEFITLSEKEEDNVPLIKRVLKE